MVDEPKETYDAAYRRRGLAAEIERRRQERREAVGDAPLLYVDAVRLVGQTLLPDWIAPRSDSEDVVLEDPSMRPTHAAEYARDDKRLAQIRWVGRWLEERGLIETVTGHRFVALASLLAAIGEYRNAPLSEMEARGIITGTTHPEAPIDGSRDTTAQASASAPQHRSVSTESQAARMAREYIAGAEAIGERPSQAGLELYAKSKNVRGGRALLRKTFKAEARNPVLAGRPKKLAK